MERVKDRLRWLADNWVLLVAGLALAGACTTTFVNVIVRYFFTKFVLVGAEELTTLFVSWTIFVGAAAGYKAKMMFGIDVLVNLFPKSVQPGDRRLCRSGGTGHVRLCGLPQLELFQRGVDQDDVEPVDPLFLAGHPHLHRLWNDRVLHADRPGPPVGRRPSKGRGGGRTGRDERRRTGMSMGALPVYLMFALFLLAFRLRSR